MTKYIDADRLRTEIERRIHEISHPLKDGYEVQSIGKIEGLSELLEVIDSLQQEQPESSKGKFVFPNFLYARTVDNKTIDVSYAPQDMTAVEYIRNDFVEQEQPMPDSTKLIELWHEDKEMLKEKDFRNDPWPLAYNAYMCGFGRGIAVNKQEQPELPTIKGWIARDDADRLGLYDQKPTRKTELGTFSGTVHSWVIGDTWIGRFSLDQTAKTLFPNLCWTDDPMEVELTIKPIQEQPEVDLWKEIHRYFNPHGMSLQFDRSKVNTILKPDQLFNFARHFYELGLNARKA